MSLRRFRGPARKDNVDSLSYQSWVECLSKGSPRSPEMQSKYLFLFRGTDVIDFGYISATQKPPFSMPYGTSQFHSSTFDARRVPLDDSSRVARAGFHEGGTFLCLKVSSEVTA